MAALSRGHVEALRQLAVALARVRWALGGSALMALSGLDVDVGDIDIMVDATAAPAVMEALPDFSSAGDVGGEPFHSAWLMCGSRAGVDIDIIGDMAVRHSHGIEVYRTVQERTVHVDGTTVPLAPLEDWMHIYSVIAPVKARKIAGLLDLDQV